MCIHTNAHPPTHPPTHLLIPTFPNKTPESLNPFSNPETLPSSQTPLGHSFPGFQSPVLMMMVCLESQLAFLLATQFLLFLT